MLLLELPSEVIQIILIYAIWTRGVKRAMRLMRVSKRFSAELQPALLSSRILDTHNSYTSSYIWLVDCTNRVLNHSSNSRCRATMIKETAEIICKENGVLDNSALHATIRSLCKLAVDEGRTSPKSLMFEDKNMKPELELLTAAAYLNCESLVRRLTSSGYNDSCDTVFGSPMRAAIKQGHANIVHALLSSKTPRESLTRWRRKLGLAVAGRAGHLDVLNMLLRLEWGPILLSDEHLLRVLKLAMIRSPNVDCFNRLVQVISSLEPKFEYFHCFLTSTLIGAAFYGCEDMVCHLLGLGASTKPVDRHGSPDDSESNDPLTNAVKGGNKNIVKMLLQANANPNPGFAQLYGCKGDPLAYAASLGSLSIAQILLDAGANINANKLSAIFYAVQREDVAMFRLLRERGADLDYQGVGKVALRMAVQEGMDSMVELLTREGVQEDPN